MSSRRVSSSFASATRWAHPEKERLRRWYARLGYRIVRSAPFEEVASHAASELATPCELLIFRKPLAG